MSLAKILIGYLRRSPEAPADDGFGRRLGQIGRSRENLVPRFLIFRNLASRRAA
ncbi:MAG: hypothetical protein ACK4GW_03400 [Pseudorhodobacter sp.]